MNFLKPAYPVVRILSLALMLLPSLARAYLPSTNPKNICASYSKLLGDDFGSIEALSILGSKTNREVLKEISGALPNAEILKKLNDGVLEGTQKIKGDYQRYTNDIVSVQKNCFNSLSSTQNAACIKAGSEVEVFSGLVEI